jgi:hypothetical protein
MVFSTSNSPFFLSRHQGLDEVDVDDQRSVVRGKDHEIAINRYDLAFETDASIVRSQLNLEALAYVFFHNNPPHPVFPFAYKDSIGKSACEEGSP